LAPLWVRAQRLLRKCPDALSAYLHYFALFAPPESLKREQPHSVWRRPSVLLLRCRIEQREVMKMLWTIFVILLVLWAVGLVSSYTLGGFIHILLVIALVVLLIQLIQGRRPVV
jgi:predicted ferric reductase